jgi:hypothetical protein
VFNNIDKIDKMDKINSYKIKYIKYKNKYLNLKGSLKGGDPKSYPIGINFEAGKIITWETKCKNCKAWANCQIGMDAPYHGRVADETVRRKGRSELSFKGYQEDKLINNLVKIFEHIKNHYDNLLLVIQIARGRAGIQMFNEVIEPILKQLRIKKYKIQYGYRTANYFECRDLDEDFVFVNIGMFAVLTQPENVYVGELCNPVQTWNIISYNKEKKEFEIDERMYSFENDKSNILNSFEDIQKIKLFGIGDCMEFITPDVYHEEAIQKLISFV